MLREEPTLSLERSDLLVIEPRRARGMLRGCAPKELRSTSFSTFPDRAVWLVFLNRRCRPIRRRVGGISTRSPDTVCNRNDQTI